MSLLEVLAERGYKGLDPDRVKLNPDGFLYCQLCGEPVESYIQALRRNVRRSCRCEREAEARKEAAEKRKLVLDRLSRSGLWDNHYRKFRFDLDDGKDSEASSLCQRYVERWNIVRSENFGLLFTGRPGTGKSFLAAAIVNDLLDRGVSAIILTTSRLVNAVRAAPDPQAVINALNGFDLVALDDLGSERDTGFALETVENFIDSRSLCGKPLLVTTNLRFAELCNCTDLAYSRLYSRVLEICCHPIVLTGPSRREERRAEKQRRFRELLGG